MTGSYLEKAALPLFLAACALAFYLSYAPLLLSHFDLGWHLAAGDLIRAGRAVPEYDPWSLTAGSRPWVNLSWLWDALASLIFQTGGFEGLLLLTVICGAAIVFVLASACRKEAASPIAVGIAVLCAAMLYPTFEAYPNIFLSASPNMATMLGAVIFYAACLKPSRWMAVLPLLMLAWVNLHGGFLIGLFIIGVFGGVALLRRDWRRVQLFFWVGCACVLASCINPLGWHIFVATGTTVGNFVQSEITEWWPYHRNLIWPGSLPGIAYMIAFAALELRRGNDCPIEARLLAWIFLALGFYQFRYIGFFFLFSAVPVACALSRLSPTRLSPKVEGALGLAGALALVVLPASVLRAERASDFPAPILTAEDAAYLQTHRAGARVLNHWNLGSLLIFRTRGEIPVFVDGRAATAYTEDLLRDYFKLSREQVNEADWDAVLAKYRIDTVLWIKAHDELRRFLVGKRGWKEVYAGKAVSIYTRPPVPQEQPGA